MKFPALKNEIDHTFKDGICPIFGRLLSDQPGDFVEFSAGALLVDKNDTSIDPKPNKLEGFVCITAHNQSTGHHAQSHLFQDVSGGQGDITLCSTACLKQLFNLWVSKIG